MKINHPSERELGIIKFTNVGALATTRCYSLVSGTISAFTQARSAREATAANQQNARETNQTNVLLNLIARGQSIDWQTAKRLGLPDNVIGKSSAVLPYYLADFEQRMGTDAANAYKAISSMYGTPEQTIKKFQEYAQQMSQATEAGRKVINDMFSGKRTADRIAESQPVFSQRIEGAEAGRRAGLEALSQTLNEIDAIQAGKGFSGDTLGNRQLRFNARRGIGTQTANTSNDALLQNALEKRALQEQGRTETLTNIDLPYRFAGTQADLAMLPGTATARLFSSAMAPLAPFNLGPHEFTPFRTPPTVEPSQSALGIVAQGGAAVGNAGLNYYLQRRTQQDAATRTNQQFMNNYQSNAWSGGGGGGGGYTPYGSGDYSMSQASGAGSGGFTTQDTSGWTSMSGS